MPDSDVTSREQRFLFSKGSPLSAAKKKKLANEMRRGDVKIRKRVRKGHGLNRGAGKLNKNRHKKGLGRRAGFGTPKPPGGGRKM